MIRAVPGAKWVRDRIWRVPRSWASCLTLRGVFGDRLEIGEQLLAWSWAEHNDRISPALAARDLALDPDADAEGDERLRSYQRTGIAFLVASSGAVLADDMGIGKTVQTIFALEQLGAYPALVVCPKTVKRGWVDEFARWAPHRSVTVVTTGSSKARQLNADTDVTVINYESLRTASRLAPYGSVRLTPAEKIPGPLNRPWAALVADEAHKAKDPASKQTRALWAVGATARYRFALTGTPVANTPEDFWSLLHFVSPSEWPRKTTFIDRYCEVSHDWHGGVSIDGFREATKQEFFAAADPRFLRRPKALVLPHLPPKTYERRWVEMSPKQAKAYRDMEKDQVAFLDNDSTVAAFDQLTLLARQSQFASAYGEAVWLDGEDGVRKCKVTLTEPSSKCEAVMELLTEIGNEPLVVFAQSRQLIDLMQTRLIRATIPHGRITGSENEKVRQMAKDDFISGHSRVLLLTLGAGSTGLDGLQNVASTACFMQRSFNAVENAQAEDRIHRLGQNAGKVTIVDLIAPDTVEESVVLPSLEGKASLLEEVTRDREILRKVLCRK